MLHFHNCEQQQKTPRLQHTAVKEMAWKQRFEHASMLRHT